jgi:hypothetical protein
MFGLFHMVNHANGLGFIALTLPLTRPACKSISKTPCHHLWLHLIWGVGLVRPSCRRAGNLGWMGGCARSSAGVAGADWRFQLVEEPVLVAGGPLPLALAEGADD